MLTRSFTRCFAVNSAHTSWCRRAWPLSARLGSSISGSSRVLSAALSVAVAAACTNEGREFGEQSETSDASTDDAGLSTGDTVVTDATTPGNDTTPSETLVVTAGDDTTTLVTDANSDDSTRDDSTRDDSTGRDSTSDAWASDTSGSATPDSTTSTTDGWGTSETSNASVTTTEPSSSADETSAEDQFGVGEPPDFGNLGSGEGRILVVNTLEDASSVDVWLAGGAEPLITRLAPRAASRELVTRGPQRVVFTRTGTHEVVGCSDWFPLRGAEQWAVVTSGGDHTCAGSGDGGTSSFRQEQPLDENPIRYVHATTPDRFSITRDDQAEPGVLEPGATLTGTSLPSCTSGCEVNYRIAAEGVADARYVTLEVTTVEELPPAGEVLLLVLGNLRQDWPSEPDALRLLRVDLDGATYELQRDPEIAFGRIGEGVATFSISTPPTTMEVASVDPYCAYDTCPLQTLRWRADTRTFFVEASGSY